MSVTNAILNNNDVRLFLGLNISKKVIPITQVDSLDNLFPWSLMFINKPGIDLIDLDRNSGGCTYLVDKYLYPNEYEITLNNNDFIQVDNPKYRFAQIVEKFNIPSYLQRSFIDNSPQPMTEGCLRYIYCHEAIIGKNCHVDSGAIIGGTDFSPVIGDYRDDLIQFPQLGGVILGDNVVVKYNTMIGKGTFGYTQIGNNTMIDFGCQIGHNCKIGESCIIAAGTIIGGSTVIGDNTTIGIGAKIRNGLKIGKNVSIGMGSVVIRDIPDNCTVVGNPAHIIEHKHIMTKGGLI